LGSEVTADDSILSELSVPFIGVSKIDMNEVDTLHCDAAITSSSNVL
jgi:hypothetical protein